MNAKRITSVGWLLCLGLAGCATVGGGLHDDQLREVLGAHRDPTDDGGQAIVVDVASGGVMGDLSFGEAEDLASYEPGNVIMPLAVAIAIENGVVTSETMISTKRDDVRYSGLPGDGTHRWVDEMSVSNGIIHSSNIVIGKVGADLGREELVRGLSAFGISVSGKAPACRLAVGQGFRVSARQIAAAYAILFNHGVDGRNGKRIVSAVTADTICAILSEVATERGTARRAAVEGVRVAGKTGTSQRFLNGAYVPRKYNATFVGCFDAKDSRVVALFRYACGVCPRHQGGLRPAEAFADFVRMSRSD